MIRALASFALLLVLLPSLVFADRESREARDVEGFNRTREIVQIAAQSSLIDATNITQIANPANASSSATTAFTYDVLNRLLQASTTAADTLPYKQQYEYDTLGSMLALWRGAGTASSTYTYAGTSYANPHAVTEVSNGVSTTTYSYDTNGNLLQKTTGSVTTTYLWDYANRLSALGVNNSTTTYGYDAFGARVYQIASTTATTTYASKWYSVASSTRSGTNYATTTEYVFNGDTLLSTIDRAFTGSTATGTVIRYIHPDHLGSTNIVSNASSTAIIQTLDYYPYGATRISTNTGGADSGRKFIGQFADTSNLDYLNARYYDPARGQFMTQDPIYQLIGDPARIAQRNGQNMQKLLEDPQMLNSYGYGRSNPILYSDKKGECVELFSAAFCTTVFYSVIAYNAAQSGINVYDVYLTNYSKSSNSFTPEAQSASWFNAGYDFFLGTAGSFGAPVVRLAEYGKALETLSIGLDALEAMWSEEIYEGVNNRKKEIEKQKLNASIGPVGIGAYGAQSGSIPRSQAAASTPMTSYSSGQGQRQSGSAPLVYASGFAPFRVVGTSASGQTLFCTGVCGN